MNVDATHVIRRQTEAAKTLLASLRENGDADDQEIVETAIEGETGLYEAIAVALSQIDECEVLEIGLKAKEGEFADRRKAVVNRADRLRAAIEQAMVMTEQEKIPLPTATIFISKRAPGLVVENEADIPSQYWVMPKVEPKLDKKALKTALDDGETIAGASLDNGSISLNIRRK
ncbi:siphovirus Gp157 family protein [Phyllobacterium sp. TAF24]|uniref:siphovirus Gp157 family protein n=1 Tax=Phyllobacterium sp. TAF24 TaxID=3233068 RepID=UPI003F953318